MTQEDFDRLAKQFQEFSQAFVQAWQPLMQAFTAAMQQVFDTIDEAYQAAGAPYGKSQDGMMRWLKEQMAERRAREYQHMVALRQWAVDDFARQIHHPELPPLPVPEEEAQ